MWFWDYMIYYSFQLDRSWWEKEQVSSSQILANIKFQKINSLCLIISPS